MSQSLMDLCAGTQCSHQFCWDCMKDQTVIFEKGNKFHGDACPWHSDNLKA